ncbi:hypothetical protein GIB67_026069 [Kingdonia uniflora]|uniref:HMA domain-containing protein n=1 Tax=Kingdonia uniflora TaxID=39325 RepID=A0A7J7M2W3_9MAGN|nr:hypothetical protein GIB67_026069 [Kingdonia uniflora]
MNMKSSKKVGGFMCRSPSSTAVCMNGDHRSVIVPRRSVKSSSMVDHNMLMNNSKYSRLVESRRFPTNHEKRSVTLSSALKRDRELEQEGIIPTRTCTLPASLPSSNHVFQVVVMRVSLHCQGCAGKVKKHLSKMEGVTSFSIDLESKRVTVMGHVSPVGVLESISKLKKAEFWPC